MPGPLQTTNPADFTQLEGLYIFEKNPPAFARGVNLNRVLVYGTTLRGPTGVGILINSEKDFNETFGTDRHAAGGAIASEVWKSLLNKQFGSMYVVRTAASDATIAESDFLDTATPVINVAASSEGVWGNDLTVAIVDATDANADHFNLVITYKGEVTTYENLDVSATGNDNIDTIIPSITTDPKVLVAVTKLADGRPDNIAADALDDTVASDGTIAAADYTGSGFGLNVAQGIQGVGIVYCANEDGTITAAVNTATLTAAAAVSDRMFVIHEGELTGAPVAVSAIATDADSFRNDRIIYAHNAPWTLDPETGNLVQTAPNSWMASILAQTDVDIHPGEEDTKRFTAGMSKLDVESLARADYITLRDAGVASLEKDAEGGFVFVSGVTTDLTPGKTEITRRRSADFLHLSVSKAIRRFVKKKNTAPNRGDMGGIITGFLRGLKNQDRIVELFGIDQESQNTAAGRAQGVEFVLMQVKLIGHMLHIVLETEIGTGVTISVG